MDLTAPTAPTALTALTGLTGLTALLLRLGAARPHALVVPVPGAAAARVAVEAELARRGWPAAYAPADADLLEVAGEPGAGLQAVIERIWRQVPAPRALVEVVLAGDAGVALDRGAALLADREHERSTAAGVGRPRGTGRGAGHGPAHGGRSAGDQQRAQGAGGREDRDGGQAGDHAGGHEGDRHHGDHGPDGPDRGHDGPGHGPQAGDGGPDGPGHEQGRGGSGDGGQGADRHGKHAGRHSGSHPGHDGGHGHAGAGGSEHAGGGAEHTGGHDGGHARDGGGGHAGGQDGGPQHGGGHMDHGHMDHGGMSTAVAGLPMADLGEDRDGLTLDRLHVPLGPVLPDWPAGLVLRVTLQGDVIQEAAAEVLDGAPAETFWTGHEGRAARELDGLARFLGVAGWPSAAARARGLRDDLIGGAAVADRVRALVGTVRRSWVLRRQLRRLPVGGTDVAGLLELRLAAVEAALPGHDGDAPRPSVHESAELLVGAELAAARLIVAALDPDTATAASEVRRG